MDIKKLSFPLRLSSNEISLQVVTTDWAALDTDQRSFYKQNDDLHPAGVYFFSDGKSIYVGESSDPFSRLAQHRAKNEKPVQQLDEIKVFASAQFHKSAVYDIETKLIDRISAEQLLELRNVRNGQKEHDYFLKDSYVPVFEAIWTVLKEAKLTEKTLDQLERTEAFRLSPFKALGHSQGIAFDEITRQATAASFNQPPLLASGQERATVTIVTGAAGTGKSVLASSLYYALSSGNYQTGEEDPDDYLGEGVSRSDVQKVCLTSGTHPTVEGFHAAFKRYQTKVKNGSKIMKTSELLNSKERFDVVIVDEAHRLLRADGKSVHGKIMHIDKGQGTELNMLLASQKHLILLYDPNQTVRDTDDDSIAELAKKPGVRLLDLTDQLRQEDGSNYNAVLLQTLKNEGVSGLRFDKKYEIRFFDNFAKMYEELKNKKDEKGRTRLLAGYSRKWLSKGKENKANFDFEIDGIKLQWNWKADGWIDSAGAADLSQVGYYHTVQGFDVDYAGVIIGKDLYLDENGNIAVNERYVVATNDRPKLSDPERFAKLRRWVTNRYYVLLTRGVRSTYVYVEDERLRAYLKKIFAS